MSKYGSDMTAEICKHLALGTGRVDSCRLAGISYETFTVWMEKYPEFEDAIKKAEASCKERCIGLIQKAAIKTWQAAAWWLERRHPDEFAQRVAHTGPDGGQANVHGAVIFVMSQLDKGGDVIGKTLPPGNTKKQIRGPQSL